MLGFFVLLASVFAVYAAITIENYKRLRTNEVSGIVAFEGQRVDGIIAEMERNVIDLALSGRQFYLSSDRSSDLGISVVEENFNAFSTAVGGGIWYEPFALSDDVQRCCFYAFYDLSAGTVRHDPDFETEQYDYHTQKWYVTITERLKHRTGGEWISRHDVVWTAPYIDAAGTNAFMTTVGAGIYDDAGSLVGISTVDWEIQSMVDRLSDIRPTANSFVLLASNKDDYIISNTKHPDAAGTGMSLASLPWYRQLRFTEVAAVNIGSFTDNGVEYVAFSHVLSNGWHFSVSIPAREIFDEIETLSTHFTLIISCSFVVLLLVTAFLLSRFINRPMQKLASGVAELGAGDLDKKIDIQSKDELGALASAFNNMTDELKSSIEQIARERAEKERIGAELDVAAKIQASMLPSIFPPFPGRSEFELYAGMQPAKEVGGDFYDFFLVDDSTLAVVMADVSGKGVPAALFMVIAKTLLKNNAQNTSRSAAVKRPCDVFMEVNNILCENNDAGMFVTAFMGYLDIPTGKLTYVNAGHNPPLVSNGESFKWLKVKPGFILAGMENMTYTQDEFMLQPGYELLLYTDGVTEAVNNSDQLFGEMRLIETVNKQINLPLEDFCASIKHEIDKFSEGAEQADDITMLALRYNGTSRMNELVIEAKTENLNAVLEFVGAQLEAANCPAKMQTQIEVCVEEIYVNIAHYAYTPETGLAAIRVDAGKDIIIEFEDSGVAYNPLEKEDPDITLSVEEREAGGLGVFMVKNLMDSIEYRREDGKNILRLVKVP